MDTLLADAGARDEVMRSLGRIEERLAGIGQQLGRLDDHGRRIGLLERQRAWLLGGAAAVALLAQHFPLPRA